MGVTRDEEFRAFVVASSPRLLRSAYLLVGDVATAEDVVQTTLMRTYLAWTRVSQADSPAAYAQRILYTSWYRLHRRRRVHEQLGSPPESAASSPSQDGSVNDRDQLRRALLELPPRQRSVLVMRFYADLSVEQTAQLLGCSSGTVKSQTAKALGRLRDSAHFELKDWRRP
jgi:RNA polymerase sigma-70 factor (sigma-E family)